MTTRPNPRHTYVYGFDIVTDNHLGNQELVLSYSCNLSHSSVDLSPLERATVNGKLVPKHKLADFATKLDGAAHERELVAAIDDLERWTYEGDF